MDYRIFLPTLNQYPWGLSRTSSVPVQTHAVLVIICASSSCNKYQQSVISVSYFCHRSSLQMKALSMANVEPLWGRHYIAFNHWGCWLKNVSELFGYLISPYSNSWPSGAFTDLEISVLSAEPCTYLAALFLLHRFILVTVGAPYKAGLFLAPHRAVQTSAVGPKMKVVTRIPGFQVWGRHQQSKERGSSHRQLAGWSGKKGYPGKLISFSSWNFRTRLWGEGGRRGEEVNQVFPD